jgi:cysteine desulfurase
MQTIITSKIEHHAVLHTADALAKEFGIHVEYVDLDSFGNIDLVHLKRLLVADDSKKLVSLMHVNNEIGNILDIHEIAKLCKSKGALLHSDTVQSIGHFNWDLQHTPIDFMVASAHKFHGPKGVGFAFIRKNTNLEPLILGGSQERGYRAGTEPLHNIVGLKEAFVASYDNLEEEKNYISGLKEYFIKKIKVAIPDVKFNGYSGNLDRSTYTIVNVCLPFSKEKSQMLLFHLDLKGIACSEGSACQSGASGGSHVLAEILSDEELQKPSVRFSFSKYNTSEEVDYVIEVLKEFSQT